MAIVTKIIIQILFENINYTYCYNVKDYQLNLHELIPYDDNNIVLNLIDQVHLYKKYYEYKIILKLYYNYFSSIPETNKSIYHSHLFPITLPHVKQRIGISIFFI